jgi:cell division protein ZapE
MNTQVYPIPPESGPLQAYRAMLAAGELATDSSQAVAAERLQALWTQLIGYDPKAVSAPSLLSRMLGRKPQPSPPRGLYMVGEVGRGKSMLMDLFFECAQVARKQRIHFHRFMQDIHTRVHVWRKANADAADPIPPLADTIAAEAALLCFDEFQVNDIANALILGRLFKALFDRGVVVVATSNVAPDDLFKGQPGRDAFLPFIALIKERMEVLSLASGRDFRRERMLGLRTWHVPADRFADRALDRAFEDLTGGAEAGPVTLTVMGRALVVPLAAEGVARFDFDALCNTALGAGDYLAIARTFHTLVLDGIPRLSPENFDRARRFIVLVDNLYEQRAKLVASADAMPDQLYQRGENAKMFERTASRLDEMQSADWMEQAHLSG